MRIFEFEFTKEQDFLFASDLHFGNALADENKIKQDLDEAKRRNARILLPGDIFDGIIPKDPRHAPDFIAPWLFGKAKQFDVAVDYVYEFFKPYKDNIDIMGIGNHEFEIIKRHETDPVQRLAALLRVKYGGYMFYSCYKVYDTQKGHSRKTLNIFAHHGLGADARVTKGMIDVNRYRSAGWRYDILIFGHKHNCFADRDCFIEPVTSKNGNYIKVDYVKNIQTGTYERSTINTDLSGWPEKKAFPPANIGGVFTKVKLKRNYEKIGGKMVSKDYYFDIKSEI